MTEFYLIINTFLKNINGLIICNPTDRTTPHLRRTKTYSNKLTNEDK